MARQSATHNPREVKGEEETAKNKKWNEEAKMTMMRTIESV